MTSQRIGGCSRPHLTRLFTHSMAGDCRGRRECRLVASAAVIVLFHKHSLLRLLPDTLPGRGGDARGVLQGGETESDWDCHDFCQERSEAVGFERVQSACLSRRRCVESYPQLSPVNPHHGRAPMARASDMKHAPRARGHSAGSQWRRRNISNLSSSSKMRGTKL